MHPCTCARIHPASRSGSAYHHCTTAINCFFHTATARIRTLSVNPLLSSLLAAPLQHAGFVLTHTYVLDWLGI